MKKTEIIMGMPATLLVVDAVVNESVFEKAFSYFRYVDETFSTYKTESEITRINNGLLSEDGYSHDMKEIFSLSEETKKLTNGYFDIVSPNGKIDPSGIVKGWAVYNAAKILEDLGCENFYVDVAGDTEVRGRSSLGELWKVGIRDPFTKGLDVVKTLYVQDKGVATSGTYVRGLHIYNPHQKKIRRMK
jgi:thiamine biosynthesis lipoprotein